MSNMEFIYSNYLDTATQINCSTGTTTSSRLWDRIPSKQFNSSGDNDDTTTTTIAIEFAEYQDVDRIILENINFKGFKVYYNSNTANLFSITNAATGTTEYTQNSETTLFFKLETTLSITSIFLEVTTTMAANEEKKIGQIWASSLRLSLTDNPDTKGFKNSMSPKEFNHKMSDGGVSNYKIADNFKANLALKYVSTTVHDSLKDIYDAWTPFIFVPFPTGTSWDGKIYEVNWIKDFDFLNYQNNFKGNGFKGTVRMVGTPK